jgi:hypothetical protein
MAKRYSDFHIDGDGLSKTLPLAAETPLPELVEG